MCPIQPQPVYLDALIGMSAPLPAQNQTMGWGGMQQQGAMPIPYQPQLAPFPAGMPMFPAPAMQPGFCGMMPQLPQGMGFQMPFSPWANFMRNPAATSDAFMQAPMSAIAYAPFQQQSVVVNNFGPQNQGASPAAPRTANNPSQTDSDTKVSVKVTGGFDAVRPAKAETTGSQNNNTQTANPTINVYGGNGPGSSEKSGRDLNDKIDRLDKTNDDLKKQVDELRKLLAERDKLPKDSKQYDNVSKQLTEIKEQLDKKISPKKETPDSSDLKNEVDDLKKKLDELTKQKRGQEPDTSSTAPKPSTTATPKTSGSDLTKEDIAGLKDLIADLTNQIDDLKKQLANFNGTEPERKELEQKQKDTERKLHELEAQNAKLNDLLSKLKASGLPEAAQKKIKRAA